MLLQCEAFLLVFENAKLRLKSRLKFNEWETLMWDFDYVMDFNYASGSCPKCIPFVRVVSSGSFNEDLPFTGFSLVLYNNA